MSLQVTGKNIELGEAFQNYVDDRLNAAIEKYVGRHLSAHIRAEKERGRFLTSCTVTLHTGLVLEASGEGADAYASAENAFERLEKRLRRYKRRLTSHHHNGMASGRREVPETLVNDYVVRVAEEDGVDHAETGEATGVSDHPVVVAETERSVREVTVSDAVMQLDLTDEAFLVFRNAANGTINVVYRRTDGNIGWIDPTERKGNGRTGT